MVFGKLFKALAGGDPPKLIVQGKIIESGRHQPRTRLGPNAAPEEAWFGLALTAAELSDGTRKSAADIVPAEFTGPIDLLERHPVGSEVRITCGTATGRQIETIDTL
jgi:hypothetical protein